MKRYLVSSIYAVNFVVTKCLDEDELGSLRLDRQGKGFALVMLERVEIMMSNDVIVQRLKL